MEHIVIILVLVSVFVFLAVMIVIVSIVLTVAHIQQYIRDHNKRAQNREKVHREMHFVAGVVAHMAATQPDAWKRVRGRLAFTAPECLRDAIEDHLNGQGDALWKIHNKP